MLRTVDVPASMAWQYWGRLVGLFTVEMVCCSWYTWLHYVLHMIHMGDLLGLLPTHI
jgi:hypothetical protein